MEKIVSNLVLDVVVERHVAGVLLAEKQCHAVGCIVEAQNPLDIPPVNVLPGEGVPIELPVKPGAELPGLVAIIIGVHA